MNSVSVNLHGYCNKLINLHNYTQTDVDHLKIYKKVLGIFLVVALHASQGGHKTTLTCKKIYVYICQKILYAKLTYCDYHNKNFEHFDLRITKIWVEKKNKSSAITFTIFSQ